MKNNSMIPYNPKKDLEDNYYNKTEVELLIAGGSGGSIDLSDYYKKIETYSKAQVDALVASGGADLSDYYTKEQVDSLISAIPETDLSNYYDKAEVDTKIEEIPPVDLSNYYDKSEVDDLISEASEVDLTNYYTKEDTDGLLDTKQDTLVSGETIKTINNEPILGSGDIQIEQSIDASTLTEGQLDYLRDKQLSYGAWQTTNIGTLPFKLTHMVTRMPMFRNATKEGNLVNNDDYSITLKKGMLYRFEFYISCAYSVAGQHSYAVLNSDTGAAIKYTISDTVTSGAHRGPLDQMCLYFKFDEDTRIEVRPANPDGNITSFYSMRVQILEISSVDMKLARFTINGKSFDENNNIDLEGLSTLSNPKLNEEVLTEFRHPVTGKPIYTKTINFGALPNKTTKSVPHNIPNVEDITLDFNRSYVFQDSDTCKYPVFWTSASVLGEQWNCYPDATTISMITGMDRTYFKAIITLEYTKTTDTAESPVRLVGGGLDPEEDIELSAGKGVVMTSENGTKYKLYIDNDGTLTTEIV